MTAQTDYLTTAEVASELACSDDSVLRAIGRGDLPALRYGRLLRVSRADLDAFIAAHTTSGPQKVRRRRT
jgi:excisionase family DNA binding protein